ncbi:response regulator [Pedobacter sp. JY14-1]|uniref:response regulator n=1 Tax=Pedobacter sp. JY14-1 TaxID=3034151 RepID=UPI0023E326F5|nr:response regulator [Pedobacter sp. JY14-1]
MNAREPKRILIIENDQSLLQLLEEIFEGNGYQTYAYQHVDDIFAVFDKHKPDVVLLDYLLPGINGGELCAQLKREPTTANVPVVICSAYPQVLLSLGSYGCNAFVAKPFEINYLLREVEDCIANPERVLVL